MKLSVARTFTLLSGSTRAVVLTSVFALVFLLPAKALLGAGVSQTTFQTAVGKLSDGQTALELKVHALETKLEDYARTNIDTSSKESLTPAQVNDLVRNIAESFVRSLDLSSKLELVKDGTVRDSVTGVSNAMRSFETNLLMAVRTILATNLPRSTLTTPVVITNAVEGSSGQVINGLQIVSKQVAGLHSTVNTLEVRGDRLSRQLFYAIFGTGLILLMGGAAGSFLVCSRSATLAGLVNANLDRDMQRFALNVQGVGKAVTDNLETQRTEMSEHLRALKAHHEAAIDRYERSLRQLHDQAAEKLGELNSKLGNAGDEIFTALRLYAGELTGNRLEAELNAATELWKRNFDQVLVQEQTRGMGCLQQFREEVDEELRQRLHQQNQQAQIVTRECVEQVRRQFQESLRAEMDSARSLWAQQAQVLRQGVETTSQSAQKMVETQLLRFKGQADQTLQGIQRDLSISREQLQAIHRSLGAEFDRLKERDEAFSDLFWPGCFRHGPLAGWRERIQAGATRREPAAIELMLALGRFNNHGNDGGDLRKLAEALHEVSRDAYQFWKVTGAKVLDASQEWKAAFQSALDTSKAPLDIMLVLEGERFDMNTMLVAGGDSNGRIVVRDVLSWIVRDKSGPVAKVLCHGWVTAG